MLRMSGSGVLALALALLLAVIGTTRRVEAQTETVLHSFAGAPADGASPFAGLIRDSAGNFYGITESGDPSSNCFAVPPGGCGVVFKIDTTGKETVLYSFKGGTTDGANPVASRLIRDSSGNFYGTTQGGGASNNGVVFKLALTGEETVLHSFKGGTADGAVPFAGVIRDSSGNFYGTTQVGGASNNGVVFKLDSVGKETVLHFFAGAPYDGSGPSAGLIRDSAGNLYGSTFEGGEGGCNSDFGCGVIFKIDPTGKETVLYNFAGPPADGENGNDLIRDSAGNLYGTTIEGGIETGSCIDNGCGVAFKLSP